MTLDEIACEEGTDRASNGLHDYMRTYDELFSVFRHDPITILEIGVLGGAGIRTWARYFDNPLSRIFGLDPHPEFCKPIEDPRVSLLFGSQADDSRLRALSLDRMKFNIVIDDGGHFASAQMKSFYFFWSRVVLGGFYCIEDLHSYAAPELCDGKCNIMQFLTVIATDVQGMGAMAVGRSEPSDPWPDVDWIMFRKGLGILRKK